MNRFCSVFGKLSNQKMDLINHKCFFIEIKITKIQWKPMYTASEAGRMSWARRRLKNKILLQILYVMCMLFCLSFFFPFFWFSIFCGNCVVCFKHCNWLPNEKQLQTDDAMPEKSVLCGNTHETNKYKM